MRTPSSYSRRAEARSAKWLVPQSRTSAGFAQVNGELGAVWYDSSGRIGGVFAFTVADGRITEAHVVVNPEKLTHLL